jgi:hypothetical protein
MKNQLLELALRKDRLKLQIQIQRLEVAEVALDFHKPLKLADAGMKAVNMIRQHPALVAGGMTALLAFRRSGVIGLAQHGLRMALLYPSAIFLGWKYVSSLTRRLTDKNKDDL